jgi:hypothetical protein
MERATARTYQNGPELLSRESYRALAAQYFGETWNHDLATLVGWNHRTIERLGKASHPIDQRRLENMISRLEEPGADASLTANLFTSELRRIIDQASDRAQSAAS